MITEIENVLKDYTFLSTRIRESYKVIILGILNTSLELIREPDKQFAQQSLDDLKVVRAIAGRIHSETEADITEIAFKYRDLLSAILAKIPPEVTPGGDN